MEVMKDQLISLKTFKLARKKGFEWNKYVDGLPTQSLLQKWLRETYNIFLTIYVTEHKRRIQRTYEWWIISDLAKDEFDINDYFIKYEEALEMGLQEALKLI